jgi:hypothetical protein
MANGDTTTQDKPQLDEFGEPIPTQEEMNKQAADREAERLKTDQTIKLVGAMNQTVAPLPMTLPTQSSPVGAPPPPMTGTQPPPGAPVAPPPQPGAPPMAPQGRMYMGPSMTAPQESAFMQSPAGTRTNLMPPPSGPPPSRLQQLQAQDQPGSRTLGIRDEPTYSDASMANQQNAMRYEAMKKFDAGDRSPEVIAAAMGRAAPNQMTPYQQAQVQRWNKPSTITPYQQAEIDRWKRQDSKPETQTETEKIAATPGSAGVEAQSARKGIFGIGARPATAAVPAVAPQGERTITRKVPVETPSAKTPSVGEVRNGWRFKGGDPSKKSNWEQV